MITRSAAAISRRTDDSLSWSSRPAVVRPPWARFDTAAPAPRRAASCRPARETYEVQSQALPAGTESPSPTTRYGPERVGDGAADRDGEAGGGPRGRAPRG